MVLLAQSSVCSNVASDTSKEGEGTEDSVT